MTRLRWLFGSAVFLASFLLFLVEPMAARQLLPVFGGSAAVWITCLVFFQTALLFAYFYAHWLARHPRWRVHLYVLALASAAAVAWAWPGELHAWAEHPVLAIFAALGRAIGLPFLMLGATSPLLQAWMARMEAGAVPYRLFALSNLASLLALAAYPAVIEPHMTLAAQRVGWGCGFVLFAALAAVLTWQTRGAAAVPPVERIESDRKEAASDEGKPGGEAEISAGGTGWSGWFRRLLWVLLPMGAAMQLSAVTSYMTANIAAIPLLWVLPLGVYLLTLIVVFQFPGLAPRSILMRLLVVLLASLGYMMIQVDSSLPIQIGILFFLIELFFACLFVHGEAYALRPTDPAESTLFYLCFAGGGALGAFLIGIAAPMLFRFNFDLAISFFLTAVLALAVTWFDGWGLRLLWSAASVLLFVLVLMIHTAYMRDTPVAVRNFYGALRVKDTVGYPGARIRTLSNGNIQHGTQIFGDLARTPTTYYARNSGVGLALANCCGAGLDARARRIGVIGLGAGTMAAYGKPGDVIRFYEINPAVLPIAHNVFTYLRDSAAKIEIVEGDARTSLTAEAPENFDVLVIDAFSGDAIPLHLLTAQAVALYRRHLAPGGVLAFHISNQHVNLEPEIALLAQNAGMEARRVSSSGDPDTGAFNSTWMLVSADAGFFNKPEIFNNSHKPEMNPKVRLWTDDYSSLLPLLHW
jgi:SAM-dependent methyltransferase